MRLNYIFIIFCKYCFLYLIGYSYANNQKSQRVDPIVRELSPGTFIY